MLQEERLFVWHLHICVPHSAMRCLAWRRIAALCVSFLLGDFLCRNFTVCNCLMVPCGEARNGCWPKNREKMELKKGWLIGAFSDLDALRLSAVRESRLPVILSSATVGLKFRVVLLSRSIQNGAARCPRSTSQTHFLSYNP